MKDHSTLIHLSLEGGILTSVRMADTGAPYFCKAYEAEVVAWRTGAVIDRETFTHHLFCAMFVYGYSEEWPDLLEAERAAR